ncbi:unnamed protein product [Hydatigera taeniaeformis]|uniref:EF-hand domain-containing protein n=1 Tax=Hydatigena taeniaeformis TaxID=6205 RepID=A0A0R3WNJ9_HYDTA|nr:unnamed protein product [Hydatigera taeniaeformis]
MEHYVISRYYRPQHVQPAALYGKVSSLNRPSYDMHRIDADQFTSLFHAQTSWGHLSLPLFRLLDADNDNLINMRDYVWLLLLISSSDYYGKLRLLFTIHSSEYLRPEDRIGFWEQHSSQSPSTASCDLSSSYLSGIGVECAEELFEEITNADFNRVSRNENAVVSSKPPDILKRNGGARSIEYEWPSCRTALTTIYTGPMALENPPPLPKSSFIDLLKTISALVTDQKGDHELLHALAKIGKQCHLAVIKRNTGLKESGVATDVVWEIEFNDFMAAIDATPLVLPLAHGFTMMDRIPEAEEFLSSLLS